jgi:type IV pilus assembly protein PilN
MATVNLLPWRIELREERKREFFVLLIIAAGGASLIVFFLYLVMAAQVSTQTKINSLLQEQIAELDVKIIAIGSLKKDRESLLDRMEVIQNLQSDRSLVVHLFDQIVRVLPPGVYLVQVDKKDNVITLSGKAESNARVSQLMRNIDASPWLINPVLTEIKSSDDKSSDSRVRDFVVQMQQESQHQEKPPITDTKVATP